MRKAWPSCTTWSRRPQPGTPPTATVCSVPSCRCPTTRRCLIGPSGWPVAGRPGRTEYGGRTRSGAEGRQDFGGGRLEEAVLGVVTDLDEREVGITGIEEGLGRGHDGGDVVATGNDLGHILRTDLAGRAVEGVPTRQFGVDLPSGQAPAEQPVGPLDGGVPVGVPADRQLPDLACARTRVIPVER